MDGHFRLSWTVRFEGPSIFYYKDDRLVRFYGGELLRILIDGTQLSRSRLFCKYSCMQVYFMADTVRNGVAIA